MILHCNFEELRALTAASELIVADAAHGHPGSVAAPPEGVGMVEQLIPRLTGDVSIETLDDQRRVQKAVSFICQDLHNRLDEQIISTNNPANEDAVSLYFDYGYSRTVLHRLDLMGAEMEAIIDLIHGGSAAAAGSVTFPD
ncbi:hypothetical protein [Longimicrobium sp.]|uniref:hypothetical protein n=1 Tax=Longimicrobium sp. TaxID=2029185 RepID=UPI002D138C30|nr:hypothetical protein [Longimicrobium sp.]HSU14412.1 hypothetical protein [Longimicrobium sp.]